jgi:hypothetical protein
LLGRRAAQGVHGRLELVVECPGSGRSDSLLELAPLFQELFHVLRSQGRIGQFFGIGCGGHETTLANLDFHRYRPGLHLDADLDKIAAESLSRRPTRRIPPIFELCRFLRLIQQIAICRSLS